MPKAYPLMIQGTHSDAGKSAIVTAFCRIFAQDGHRVAPFKSQNMALNSYITLDGKEIGRAQGVQAEAAGVIATTDMNPILIKPTREYESQIVVHGKPYQNMQAAKYRQDFFDLGLDIITKSYERLASSCERIVIEGAGSPAEINLNDRELVNMRVARIANAPVILVGDIEKGGVFASLVGTLKLLEPEDRDRVIGVMVNKFRGDVSLLEPGLRWFEEYTGKPVLGVIPYIKNLNIDAEDSVILSQYTSQMDRSKEIDIAVIRYPMISNFTDVDPFFVEPDCHVRFVSKGKDLGEPDIIILPGSKNTIEDMMFLQESGLAQKIQSLASKRTSLIFGICGGYQMLGKRIEDPHGIESPHQEVEGLSLIPLRTRIMQEKTTILSKGVISMNHETFAVEGYEIHMGESIIDEKMSSDGELSDHGESGHDGEAYGMESYEPLIVMENRMEGSKRQDHQVMGTYFHGIFHNDLFREQLLNDIRGGKGLAPIHNRVSFNQLREEAFDRLADSVREHVQLDYIEERMREFYDKKRGDQVERIGAE
jgi:adenosylcobyric acid synthase